MPGEVPSGWSESRVGRVAQVVGGTGFPEKYQGRTGLTYPFLKVSDMNAIGNDRLIFTAANTVSAEDLRSLAAHAWPPGTTIFPKVGAALLTNKRRVLAVDAAFDNNVMGLVPREAEPWFLYYFMSTVDFAAHVQTGALPSINQSTVAEIRLLLPPRPEQKKIAAILSSVDEAIQAAQAVIDQTRRVKEGLLHDLLTRGLPGHTRFKQTEIGEIPESWEVRTLGQVCHGKYAIVDGPFGSNLKTEHYRSTGVPVIQSAMITTGQFSLGTGSYVYVEPTYFDEIRRSSVRGGDIVMAKIGARAGRSAVLPRCHPESVLAGNCLKLSPDNALAKTEFVAAWLTNAYDTGILAKITAGNAQPAISISHLRELKLPLPHLSEQGRIVDLLSDATVALSASESNAHALRSIKSGLLQDLLTGRVRVTP